MEKKYLRAKEAWTFLRICKATFWKWVKAGKLPSGTLLSPRCRIWSVDELEGFISAQEKAAAHE